MWVKDNKINLITFGIYFVAMMLWPKIGLAHLTLLGSIDGKVEGKVIHLTMSLPEEIRSSGLEATQEGLRNTIKFSNNGQSCQLNLKNVATAIPTVMTMEVNCNDFINALDLHLEYMVGSGYQFAVAIADMTYKGTPKYVLLDSENENAQFHFESTAKLKSTSNNTSPSKADNSKKQPMGFGETLRQFIGMGMWHIYTGYDHILFVLALILVSPELWPLIKTVTAFTIAHSVTLILSTLNIVNLSPDIVEPMIAFSIAFVAFEDLISDYRKRKHLSSWRSKRWLVAFGFGLFHGLGFSGALKEINIPQSFLIPSLFSFNVGVELAQITIIALMIPVLYFIKKFSWQRQLVQVLLLIIGLLGSIWFVQRVVGIFHA